MGSFKASAAVTAHLRSNPLMDVGDEVFNIDQSQTDRKELGAGTRVDGKVKQQLENLYTGQYDPSKRKKKQRQFDKVNKQTSNLTSLKFDQMRIADGLIPENIQVYFLSIDSWGWSSIIAASLTGGKPLRCTMHHLFSSYEFFQKGLADEKQFYSFADLLENAYQKHKNTYHNSTHATDVLQTVHHMINATGLYHWLSDLELMSMLFAAAVHDAEHTGTTNDFHVSTRSPLAILYNDQSVLENHHLAVAWSILDQPNCNILENLDDDERTYFKELVTEMVLSTDMAMHFPQVNEIKATIENTPIEYWKQVLDDNADYPSSLEKPKIMSLMMHAADISNAFKPWHLASFNASLILQEFFNQGDQCKIRRMAPPPLCDRRKTDIPVSQINFSKFLVRPTFELLSQTVRLLAEIFLPKTQVQQTETVDSAEMAGMSGTGNSLFARPMAVNHFKKNSLRPNTPNINVQTVIRQCNNFDSTWQSNMIGNTSRWEYIQERMKEEEGILERCTAAGQSPLIGSSAEAEVFFDSLIPIGTYKCEPESQPVTKTPEPEEKQASPEPAPEPEVVDEPVVEPVEVTEILSKVSDVADGLNVPQFTFVEATTEILDNPETAP